MLTDFYISFSAVCFTLLGLWLIVVQTRHAEWRGSPLRRRRAYGVGLHFSLPGLMSLLALVNPSSAVLWRTSFAIVAIGGAAVLIAVRGPAPGKLGLTAYVSATVLYALIGILAIAPRIVSRLGLEATPVRVEAVLLTILVFIGANVAWLLLFEQALTKQTRSHNMRMRKAPSSTVSPASWGGCPGPGLPESVGQHPGLARHPPIPDSQPLSRHSLPQPAEPDDTGSRQADSGS